MKNRVGWKPDKPRSGGTARREPRAEQDEMTI